MINWQYFPKCDSAPDHLVNIVKAFESGHKNINSAAHKLASDGVLSKLRPDLELLGFKVEKDKTKGGKVSVPVLFGRNGKPERSFDADAYNTATRTVLEVEAGRGIVNNQFLKDVFQACVMANTDYLAVALRNDYRDNDDFKKAVNFLDTIYASNRLKLPLSGIMVIGY